MDAEWCDGVYEPTRNRKLAGVQIIVGVTKDDAKKNGKWADYTLLYYILLFCIFGYGSWGETIRKRSFHLIPDSTSLSLCHGSSIGYYYYYYIFFLLFSRKPICRSSMTASNLFVVFFFPPRTRNVSSPSARTRIACGKSETFFFTTFLILSPAGATVD